MSGADLSDPWTKPKIVTRLVPYRIKKIDGGSESGDSVKRHRPTRDEKAVLAQGIPFTVDYIINCSMDNFNDILNSKSLNTEQLNLVRDIRKRGKNKVHA